MELADNERLEPAGTITADLEGVLVVQCPEHCRPLEDGSLLVLEDRTVVGRVEEVFGPVTQPMYALQYAGKPPQPKSVTAGEPAAGCQSFLTDGLLRISFWRLFFIK